MRHNMLLSEDERSKVGRFHLYTQIAKQAIRPRKCRGGWIHDQGRDALLILAFSLGVGGYLAVKIGSGFELVLRAHGLI